MPEKKRRSVRPIQTRVTEDTIATRAYAKWVARGCPSGDGTEDWFAAQSELELENRKSGRSAKQAQA